MKKLIGLLLVLAFFVGVAGSYTADAAVKKVVKKVVKKKVKKAKKVMPKVVPAPVVPAPVAPAPKPAPVVVKPAAPAGLFGWGLLTDVTGSYIYTGKGKYSGAVGLRGDVILDDMLGLGGLVGLSSDAVKYRLGIGGVYGVDINGNRIKAIPIYVDGLINLPADAMFGLDTYVGGGLNYTVYGSGRTAGSYGAEAYIGLKQDLGLGLGKTMFELGYSATRADGSTPKLSAKGVTFSVSQPIML